MGGATMGGGVTMAATSRTNSVRGVDVIGGDTTLIPSAHRIEATGAWRRRTGHRLGLFVLGLLGLAGPIACRHEESSELPVATRGDDSKARAKTPLRDKRRASGDRRSASADTDRSEARSSQTAGSRLPLPGSAWTGEGGESAADDGDDLSSPDAQLPAGSLPGLEGVGVIEPPLPEIDDRRVQAVGIRKLVGKHLILYTDLASQADVDELPVVFDQAVPQWCRYFGIDEQLADRWRIVGHLMKRKEVFQGTGRLPDDLPPFLHGYQRGSELWVYEQPSAYYRRHLLLHEGTHAFMNWFLGAAGPPWYMEGMAELLGTHHWQSSVLTLAVFPANRDEVPQWGRIKLVRDQWSAGQGLTVDQVLEFGPRAHLRPEPYGWCWALAALLEGHPQFRARFHQLIRHVHEDQATFNRSVKDLYADDWRQLSEQWQWFFTQLDYGFDVEHEAFIYDAQCRADDVGFVVTVRVDRGWQSTGIDIPPGSSWQLEADGEFQVGADPAPWISQAQGITLDYVRGHPLGILLAAASDQEQPLSGLSPLVRPQPVGRQRRIQFDRGGTLFLRINDWPSGLLDNRGQLQVKIRRIH